MKNAPFPDSVQLNPSHITSPHQQDYSHQNNEELASEYVDEMPLTIEEQYKQRLMESLSRNNYNRKKAAQELGISERTLYRKIRKFGLEES